MNMYTTSSSRLGTMPSLLSHVDASTQADLVGYESEDERMGRRLASRLSSNKHCLGTPYSKVDIREQYCINSKEIAVLESAKNPSALFGCLSKHQESSCHSRHSLLSLCVDRHPSDENLHELTRKPLPRRPVDEIERAYIHRRNKIGDPGRYAWIPEDEEPSRMELARSVKPEDEIQFGRPMSYSSEHLATNCPAHSLPPPPPPPSGSSRTKHVSFARSHTLTSFDDAIMEMRRGPQPYRSQERLILSMAPPARRTGSLAVPPYVLAEKKSTKKPPMKTQATQTGTVGREPPHYLSLSPRTIHRVTTVSQAAQTNGQPLNGRRLMKSYSEAGYNFGIDPLDERFRDHDVLMRTQSEEPRSPYSQPSNLPWPTMHAESSQDASRSRKVYKEILIDFEPADMKKHSWSSVTQSDGMFASDFSSNLNQSEPVFDRVDGIKVSLSGYSTEEDIPIKLGAMMEKSQIKIPQDSLDEEFHENFVYREMIKKQQSLDMTIKSNESISVEHRDNYPSNISNATLSVAYKASPFASSDSLTTEHKADSDGIWNESQLTVLQAGSDNSNGLGSKKHILLMQHQQRSSMDTEALDEDLFHQLSPKQESLVPSVIIATVHKSSESKSPVFGSHQLHRHEKTNLSPVSSETRRKTSRVAPDKEEEVPTKDISENSTTDDYATAHDNSTDTSLHQKHCSKPGSKEGSSFESASSLHSVNKEDTQQMQVVPSSPTPAIIEESTSEGIVERIDGRKRPEEREESASIESSSSGSYSVASGHREKEWTDEEKNWTKRHFTLDLSPENSEIKTEEHIVSPVQTKIKPNSAKAHQGPFKKSATAMEDNIATGMVRSPAMPEGFKKEDWLPPQRSTPHTPEEIYFNLNEAELSSDESSFDYKNTGIMEDTINGHSPRRHRKRGIGKGRRVTNEANRRKGQCQLSPPKYYHSPVHSPRKSPRTQQKGTKNEDSHLKAASAESLRSVSPGSDSVFYNEGETQLLCHSCGRGVDTICRDESSLDIVQPPARFADSPEDVPVKPQRLFKKQEKRFRSDERDRGERRRHTRIRAENLRAKSEERGKDKTSKSKLRPHAHSTDASFELLRGAESSPSISDPFVDDEPRIYMDSFQRDSWICIKDDYKKKDEVTEITTTEKEFVRKYLATTHRMVHRKSSIEMFRRLQDKTFEDATISTGETPPSLEGNLQEILRAMIILWCTQKKALEIFGKDCDKKIIVRRQSGEFGFRIHGSKPVVVSAIEPDTPAEMSGLEVGDIVLSVNGISVLEASHSDVVKLAHSGSDTLELELARTQIATLELNSDDTKATHSGFLYKMGPDGKWHERWFVLKEDSCFYCYKSQNEGQPLGALLLVNYSFIPVTDVERLHCFALQKPGAKSLELSAKNADDLDKWKLALEAAAASSTSQQAQWLARIRRYISGPAAAIPQPECFGHLTQLEDKWRRRYCVLKKAALILYSDSASEKALGVACLQGYRVQSSGPASKRFSFEVIPPESKQKHFYFYTDSEMEKKRWIAALEYSIDCWIKVS